MSSPKVSEERLSEIREQADKAISELEYQLEAAGAEASFLQPETLRVDPDLHEQIDVIGGWDPAEARSVVAADGTAIEGLARRIQEGAAGAYLSEEQTAKADRVRSGARRLFEGMRSYDVLAIAPGHRADAEEHVAIHAAPIRKAVDELERSVVSAEAGAVPVIEPYERNRGTIGVVVAIGAVAVAGLIVWGLLSS
jgi:hypothetical protein